MASSPARRPRKAAARKPVTDAKALSSGRKVRAEIVHKVRGLAQIFQDVEHLYPRRAKLIAWSIPALVVILFSWRYWATENHRLLTGTSLGLGHVAFGAIRDADALSEDLTAVQERRRSFAEAETQMARFQQQAKGPEQTHAATVLSFYLDEVRQLPDRDLQCASAMEVAQSTERQFEAGTVTRDQLNIAELAELKCMSARSQAVAIKIQCRDEALSYLLPDRQPPVDQCVFRHATQTAQTR